MVKPKSENPKAKTRVRTAAKRGGSRAPFYVALVVIALAGTAAIAYVATRPDRGDAVTEVDPNLPPATAQGYLLGDSTAPVQIIEFADFQCPACERFATITGPDVRERIVEAGLASYRFYDFPLPMHRNSFNASLAAACANDQGKFWEYHDRLFAGQLEWSEERDPQDIYGRYAQELGLDVPAWERCYESRTHERTILANRDYGIGLGVNQTPTFIIGGRMIGGAIPYDEFKRMVDEAAARAGGDSAAVPAR